MSRNLPTHYILESTLARIFLILDLTLQQGTHLYIDSHALSLLLLSSFQYNFILIGHSNQSVQSRRNRGILSIERYAQGLTHMACTGEASSYSCMCSWRHNNLKILPFGPLQNKLYLACYLSYSSFSEDWNMQNNKHCKSTTTLERHTDTRFGSASLMSKVVRTGCRDLDMTLNKLKTVLRSGTVSTHT